MEKDKPKKSESEEDFAIRLTQALNDNTQLAPNVKAIANGKTIQLQSDSSRWQNYSITTS